MASPSSPAFSFSFPSQKIDQSSSSPLSTPSSSNNSSFNSLYCERKLGQVLELNAQTQQLNLILTCTAASSSSSFTPAKFLYTLKCCPLNAKRMICNKIGSLLAIQGSSTNNLSVLRLSGGGPSNLAVIEEVEIILDANVDGIVGMAWHPASPADHHLVLLTRQGKILIYDLLTAKAVYEDSSALLQLTHPEQEIKLPFNRSDCFAGISFPSQSDSSHAPAAHPSWSQFSAILVKESGDIFALCPLLPRNFRARRQAQLLPLLKEARTSFDVTTKRWLDDVLVGCEFISGPAGDTDWVLARGPVAFEHLQPRLQGPFLIQPEPMEIRQLASYDRITDFACSFNRLQSHVDLGILAFGSGKVDLIALPTVELAPIFQLKSEKEPFESSNNLIGALIESVDLKAASPTNSSHKRSVNCQVKIHSSSSSSPHPDEIILSIDDSLISIKVNVNTEVVDEAGDHENDDGNDNHLISTIDCDAQILLDGLKNGLVTCISNDYIYPGAIKLPKRDACAGGDNSAISSFTVAPCPILDSITKYAFPLDRLEIENGAQQLEGLIENLMKNLNRLKATRSSKQSAAKLPESVDEISAVAFNDRVLECQESLVSPSLRVAHEIALRSNQLAEILQREREILVRARRLLLSKPERLEGLMEKIAQARLKHQKLTERLQRTLNDLSKLANHEGQARLSSRLSSTINQLIKISPENTINKSDFVDILSEEPSLVESQLQIQSEMLTKLKLKLGRL